MSEATESRAPESAPTPAIGPWRTNALLFVATIASVILTGIVTQGADEGAPPWRESIAAALHPAGAISRGAQFAGSLLLILVAHELGHYVAARVHKVDASLPFFIPLPLLSPFGTMGAVIRMRGVIPTRRALLDIGASGPLAGLCFAIPLYVWGSAHSHLVALPEGGGGDMMQLGESVLMKIIDHLVAPAKPEGMDLNLSPVAFGAWGGMFVTMINLLPVGQLDGGHVAYSLFGPKQDRYAQLIHRSMLVFFFVIVFGHVSRDVRSGLGLFYLGRHLANALFWLVWFNVLAILGSLSRPRPRDEEPKAGVLTIRTRLVALGGLVLVASIARDNRAPLLPLAFFIGLGLLIAMEVKGGTLRSHELLDHPPTAPAPLDSVRAAIAVLTLAIFALLFMPEPFSM